MSKELELMQRSMKMLDRRSLNPGQLRTLQEIDELKSPNALDEVSDREKQFRHLLSEVRMRTDVMRKRKYTSGH